MKTHTLKKNEGHKGTLAKAVRQGEFLGFVWAFDDLPFQQAGMRPSFYEIEEGDTIIVIDNEGNEIERASWIDASRQSITPPATDGLTGERT